MRVLLLGAGQVATAFHAAALPGYSVTARARAQLDIVDAVALQRTVAEVKPNWIVNAAAYTAVDRAEDESGEAIAVNDAAVAAMTEAADAVGAALVHISTDFVFDGRAGRAYLPTDATNPLSVYGTSKRDGERHVLKYGQGRVLRTSWVYASSGRNFVLTMLKLMRERQQLTVVSDQIGSPTWAASVARAIWGLIEATVPAGIYHWADLGVASWYDFAVAIAEEAQARGLLRSAIPIVPIASAQYPTRAARPAFSVLDTASTRAQIKTPARHWRNHLRMMLDELRT